MDFTHIFAEEDGGAIMNEASTTSNLPIIVLCLACLAIALHKGWITVPGIPMPPMFWRLAFYARGRYWRIKNLARWAARGLWREGKEQWRLFRLAIRGNPKTTDVSKLMKQVIVTQLNRELAEGGINANNKKDWLERFSVVKGLESLRPYHGTVKLGRTGNAILKGEIKQRMIKAAGETWTDKDGGVHPTQFDKVDALGTFRPYQGVTTTTPVARVGNVTVLRRHGKAVVATPTTGNTKVLKLRRKTA